MPAIKFHRVKWIPVLSILASLALFKTDSFASDSVACEVDLIANTQNNRNKINARRSFALVHGYLSQSLSLRLLLAMTKKNLEERYQTAFASESNSRDQTLRKYKRQLEKIDYFIEQIRNDKSQNQVVPLQVGFLEDSNDVRPIRELHHYCSTVIEEIENQIKSFTVSAAELISQMNSVRIFRSVVFHLFDEAVNVRAYWEDQNQMAYAEYLQLKRIRHQVELENRGWAKRILTLDQGKEYYSDLYQSVVSEGIWKAFIAYDPDRESNFANYSAQTLRRERKRFFDSQMRLIHSPENMIDARPVVRRSLDSFLTKQSGRSLYDSYIHPFETTHTSEEKLVYQQLLSRTRDFLRQIPHRDAEIFGYYYEIITAEDLGFDSGVTLERVTKDYFKCSLETFRSTARRIRSELGRYLGLDL